MAGKTKIIAYLDAPEVINQHKTVVNNTATLLTESWPTKQMLRQSLLHYNDLLLHIYPYAIKGGYDPATLCKIVPEAVKPITNPTLVYRYRFMNWGLTRWIFNAFSYSVFNLKKVAAAPIYLPPYNLEASAAAIEKAVKTPPLRIKDVAEAADDRLEKLKRVVLIITQRFDNKDTLSQLLQADDYDTLLDTITKTTEMAATTEQQYVDQIALLTRQVQDLGVENKQFQDAYYDIEGCYTETKDKLDTAEAQLLIVGNDLQLANGMVDQLKVERNAANQRFDLVDAERNVEVEANKTLKAEIAKLQGTVTALQDQLRKENDVGNDLTVKNGALVKQINDMQAQFQAVITKLKDENNQLKLAAQTPMFTPPVIDLNNMPPPPPAQTQPDPNVGLNNIPTPPAQTTPPATQDLITFGQTFDARASQTNPPPAQTPTPIVITPVGIDPNNNNLGPVDFNTIISQPTIVPQSLLFPKGTLDKDQLIALWEKIHGKAMDPKIKRVKKEAMLESELTRLGVVFQYTL